MEDNNQNTGNAAKHLLLVDIQDADTQYAVRVGKDGNTSEIYAFDANGKQIDVPAKPAHHSANYQIAMDLASEKPAGPGKILVNLYVMQTGKIPVAIEKKEMQYGVGALDGIKAMHNGGAHAAAHGMSQTPPPVNYKMAGVAPKPAADNGRELELTMRTRRPPTRGLER